MVGKAIFFMLNEHHKAKTFGTLSSPPLKKKTSADFSDLYQHREKNPPFDALVSWYSQFGPVDVTRVGGSRLGRTLKMVRFWLLVAVSTQLKNITYIYIYTHIYSQNGWTSSPKFGVKIPKIFELPPPSYVYIYIYMSTNSQSPTAKIPWRFTEASTRKAFQKRSLWLSLRSNRSLSTSDFNLEGKGYPTLFDWSLRMAILLDFPSLHPIVV